MSTIDEEIDTLNCWECLGIPSKPKKAKCHKCGGGGRVYWVGGYPYAITKDGEKEAREKMRALERART